MPSYVAQLITGVKTMTSETIRKLRQTRLPEFARGYEEQLDAPETYSAMTFDERLAMLVDREADAKHDKHIKRW